MPAEIISYVKTTGVGGKFVVLISRDDDESGAVVFSDFTQDFQHADIVRRWEQGRKTSVASSGHRIAGGGWWRLEAGLLALYGQSAAYGRFDPKWVRAHVEAGAVMTESRIDIL